MSPKLGDGVGPEEYKGTCKHVNTGKDGIVIWIMLTALRLLEDALRMNF